MNLLLHQSIQTKKLTYIRFDNHNMFAIGRIASKLNAVNNLVRKNLSNNNNNDNNDNNDNINRWSSDLWSDSTPKSITNKLLKLLDSSGLKGKMQIRKSGRFLMLLASSIVWQCQNVI